jgi:hypothetical protein
MDSVSNGFGRQEFSKIREEIITRPTVEKTADLWRFGALVRSRTDRESNGAYFPYSERAEPTR